MAGGGRPSILTVFAHPAPDRTPVHKALLKTTLAAGDAQVRDLYELYPDFMIDLLAEQAALAEPDLIVLQFPLHWFSPPALLIEWLDAVWRRGFAYGEGGASLMGRTLVCVFTTGARARDFEPDGVNRYSLAEFLRPVEQAARRCGLRWAEPFAVHETSHVGGKGVDKLLERWRSRLDGLAQDARARRARAA